MAIMKKPQTWQEDVEKTLLNGGPTSAKDDVDVHGHATTKGHADVRYLCVTWDCVDVEGYDGVLALCS